tara:strand:+ start:1628 stop:1864 length:237 start_codon:yes stop_codon:yes gene_type:complete
MGLRMLSILSQLPITIKDFSLVPVICFKIIFVENELKRCLNLSQIERSDSPWAITLASRTVFMCASSSNGKIIIARCI